MGAVVAIPEVPKVKWLALVLALVGAFSAGNAAESSRTATIGGKEFRFSTPTGFVEVCSTDAAAASVLAHEVPPTNQLVGCYATRSDVDAWTNRTGGVFESYLVTSVMKDTIGRTVSSAEFAAFRRQMNAQVATLHEKLAPSLKEQIKQAEKEISATNGVTIRFESGQIVPLGVFDEGEGYIASAWLVSNQFSVDGKPTTANKVRISTAVLVHGKVLVLFTNGEYRQASDIRKYQDIARTWRKTVIAENT